VNEGLTAKLEYARPGTIRPKRNWRPWVATTLWLLPLCAGIVVLIRPRFIVVRVSDLIAVLILLGALPFLLLSLVTGWFVFPKRMRDSAGAILLIAVAILLPVVMWLQP